MLHFQNNTLQYRSNLLNYHGNSVLREIRLIQPLKSRKLNTESTSSDAVILFFDKLPPVQIKSFVSLRTLLIHRHYENDFYWNQFGFHKVPHIEHFKIPESNSGAHLIQNCQFIYNENHPYNPSVPSGLFFSFASGTGIMLRLDFETNSEEVTFQFIHNQMLPLNQKFKITSIPKTHTDTNPEWQPFLATAGEVPSLLCNYHPEINPFRQQLSILESDPIPEAKHLHWLRQLRTLLIKTGKEIIDIQLAEVQSGQLKIVPPLEFASNPPSLSIEWINHLIGRLEK